MKKDYLKPDAEYVSFRSEIITYEVGVGSDPYAGEDEV